MMEISTETNELMTRYLLGMATPVEQEALEDRYAADPEVFEQLVEVENDLADRYARHKLSAAEQNAFERHVLSHPRRRARAQFAEAWDAHFDESAGSALPLKSASLSEQISQWWHSSNGARRLALSLSAAALLLISGWGLWRLMRTATPIDIAQQANLPTSSQPTGTPLLSATPIKSPMEPNKAPLAVVTLTLNAALTRGTEPAAPPTLTIPANTTEVRLRLKSDASGYARYRLTLQTARGRTLHSVITTNETETFVVSLPARFLPSGAYALSLSGLHPSGEADHLSKTSFRVKRPETAGQQ